MIHKYIILSILALLSGHAFAESLSTATSTRNDADVPANIHELPPISSFREGAKGMAYPHLPPFRTTIDGRIGIRVNNPPQINFFLVSPESLQKPLMLADPGVRGVIEQFDIKIRDILSGAGISALRAKTICEKKPSNPSSVDGGKDQYEFSVIGSANLGNNQFSIISLDFIAKITQPKTANAKFDSITYVANSLVSQPLDNSVWESSYVEPNITNDGQLMLIKMSARSSKWSWQTDNSPTRDFEVGSRPTLYSYNANPTKPCDVKAWTRFDPISHAFHDSRINKKYGFAQYQLRDSEGNLIDDGEQIAGSQYPWLSQNGSMLIMEVGGEMAHYEDSSQSIITRYPVSCGDPNSRDNCSLGQNADADDESSSNEKYIRRYERYQNVNRGVVAVGLWTHGKMVELDNLINYMDYGPNNLDKQHLTIQIYRPNTGNGDSVVNTQGKVLIAHNKQGSYKIPFSVDEGAQIGSIENRFNHLPNMNTITPRDIVWQVSKGNGVTAEVVFDDYIDPNVLIYAPMNTSFENDKYKSIDPAREMQGYNNGFKRTGLTKGAGFVDPIHFQNAATADITVKHADDTLDPDFFEVPKFGVAQGPMRIEPVALGGIRGKGAWLEGTNNAGIRFTIPSQTNSIEAESWYYGIFIDPRQGNSRRILTLPNGAGVVVNPNRNRIRFKSNSNQTLRTIRLPNNSLRLNEWSHIGLKVERNLVRLYFNGNLINNWNVRNNNPFYLRDTDLPGDVVIGVIGNNSYRGWVDDFKMIRMTDSTSAEMMCEHARGTLVSLDDSYTGPLTKHAVSADTTGFTLIDNELTSNGYTDLKNNRYACYVDYQSIVGANMAEIPANTKSLRQALLQPLKITLGSPRPDERTNGFCTSCHIKGHPETLNIEDALSLKSNVMSEADPRRQPSQPPVTIYGAKSTLLFGTGVSRELIIQEE